MHGPGFEIVGNKIAPNGKTMANDLLLFWGTQAANVDSIPEEVKISAAAAFHDGKTDGGEVYEQDEK